jgi:radical SAM protein with 4Fe4S-binding SPASM domain
MWGILVQGRYDFTYDLMSLSAQRMSLTKRLNLFLSGANLIYRRPMPWSWPLHMQIELTNYCNLRCPVCPTGIRSVRRPAAAMDPELFKRMMTEVGPYLLTASLWAWGEPLLHPELREILRTARGYPVATLLSTNGQNLDDDCVIDALISYPPTYLIVAIDGLTDETNSEFRRGAKLAPILSGVRRMAERREEEGLSLPLLHMRYIVMKHNQHEVPYLEDFAREKGFDLLTVRTLSIIDASEQTHRELVPDLDRWAPYEYDKGKRVRRQDFFCLEPYWFPTVFADGTVVACEQDYNAQYAFGAVSEDTSFADLWFSRRSARIRKDIRDNPDGFSFCRNCPYADRRTTDVSIEAIHLNSETECVRIHSRGNGS